MKTLVELCCEKTPYQRNLWPLDVRYRIPMNNVQGMINYYEDKIHWDPGQGWVTGVNSVLDIFPIRKVPNQRCYILWYNNWVMSMEI